MKFPLAAGRATLETLAPAFKGGICVIAAWPRRILPDGRRRAGQQAD
jgi:hypothetical protein